MIARWRGGEGDALELGQFRRGRASVELVAA